MPELKTQVRCRERFLFARFPEWDLWAMEWNALLPEKPACFQVEKPVLGNEPGSKQASDSNNALRSIADV